MPELNGTAQRDSLEGTAGVDTLSGRDGSDTLLGGAGDDLIYGHSAADTVPGSEVIDAVRVAQGLVRPLYAASPPGDPDRLFIVEQHTGRILILDLVTGQTIAQPFLDLADNALSNGGEQGLLGLAFHPNYAANGLFYINLTNAAGNTEVRELRRADANTADPASSRLILTFFQPFTNHNGGWLGFGPDGFLYIASGDGGSGGDPQNNAQNLDNLLGKMLRIDVNSDAFPGDAARNYAIPAGNPFAGPVAGADEIWIYGLRNPWRASFDAVTGDLWLGDVGQGAREEIDRIPAGQSGLNLGWRFREGFQNFSGNAPGGLTDPLLDYGRSTPGFNGFSVTGGYVYRGPGGMEGLYVFGEFGSGNVWSVTHSGGVVQDFLNRNSQLVLSGGGDIDQITSFAVDGRGRLYLIGLDGDIHRLSPRATAGDGLDYLRGGEGNDWIFGGFGFDDAHGNQGDDTLYGGHGGDWVVGGQGQDSLSGDDGDDLGLGNLGDDTVWGGAGADVLRGGQGADSVEGGTGADLIYGDRGDDTLAGGTGADTFASFAEAGLDRVIDFNRGEGDRVRLDPGSVFSVSQQGSDIVVEITGGARVVLVGVSLSSLDSGWIGVS